MPSPVPKPDHERQRRNKGEQFVRSVGGGVPAPVARRWRQWLQPARDWWRCLVASPMGTMYSAPDWQVALRAADYVDAAERLRREGEYVKARQVLGMVQSLEDRLLVTVRARRMARLDIPDDRDIVVAGQVVTDYRKMLEEKAHGHLN